MALLGKSNKSQGQRKAALGAAFVISSVVLLFTFGLYLTLSKMAVREKHAELKNDPVSIVERVGAPVVRRELIQKKMSVVPIIEEKTVDHIQRKESKVAAGTTDLTRPFNVSMMIDNSRDGGGKGEVIITVMPALAPIGAKRFAELVESHFFDGCRFFRVLHNFMGQFGINGDPSVQENWRGKAIKDDPVKGTNKRGAVTFATSGPDR